MCAYYNVTSRSPLTFNLYLYVSVLVNVEDNEFSGALPTEFGLLDELEFVHFGKRNPKLLIRNIKCLLFQAISHN